MDKPKMDEHEMDEHEMDEHEMEEHEMEEKDEHAENNIEEDDTNIRPPDAVYRETLLPFHPFMFPFPLHHTSQQNDQYMNDNFDESNMDEGSVHELEEHAHELDEDGANTYIQEDDRIFEMAVKESLETMCFDETVYLQQAMQESENEYKQWMEKQKKEMFACIRPFIKRMAAFDTKNECVYSMINDAIQEYENCVGQYEQIQISCDQYSSIVNVLNKTRIQVLDIQKILDLFLVIN
jgi:hypothetical protein